MWLATGRAGAEKHPPDGGMLHERIRRAISGYLLEPASGHPVLTPDFSACKCLHIYKNEQTDLHSRSVAITPICLAGSAVVFVQRFKKPDQKKQNTKNVNHARCLPCRFFKCSTGKVRKNGLLLRCVAFLHSRQGRAAITKRAASTCVCSRRVLQ